MLSCLPVFRGFPFFFQTTELSTILSTCLFTKVCMYNVYIYIFIDNGSPININLLAYLDIYRNIYLHIFTVYYTSIQFFTQVVPNSAPSPQAANPFGNSLKPVAGCGFDEADGKSEKNIHMFGYMGYFCRMEMAKKRFALFQTLLRCLYFVGYRSLKEL